MQRASRWPLIGMTAVRRAIGLLGDLAFRLRLRMLEGRAASIAPTERRTFLFWVPGGMPLMLDVEAAIAKALQLRGHKVHAIICNGATKACMQREVGTDPDVTEWSKRCESCRKDCEAKLRAFGIEYSFTGDYVSDAELAQLRQGAQRVSWNELPALEHQGVNVGKNVKSSVTRFFKGRPYNGDQRLLAEYTLSGLASLAAANAAFERLRPTDVFMSHGIYVDWGPPLRAALAQGLRVTCWGGSYLHAQFYFRHPSDYSSDLDFHRLDSGTWERERQVPLSAREQARLDRFLSDRYVKGVSFDLKKPRAFLGNPGRIRKKYGLRRDRKVWALLTHINWDAVSDYAPMLFEDFDKWVLSTIERACENDSVQWLIKVHPAEAWHNPTTGIQALIERHYPKLPDHIRLIRYDDNISPLDFFNLIDGAVTVYGTSGLEIACHGKPVVVAGAAHYSRKGFTRDPGSVDEYFALLDSAHEIPPLTEAQRQLALRYAYIYFIRRQIPFPPVENPDAHREHGFWKFDSRRAGMLLPGGNRYVDFIAQRIIDNGEFVLPEALLDRDAARP